MSGIGGVVPAGPVIPGRCSGGSGLEGTGSGVGSERGGIPGTGDIWDTHIAEEDGAEGMLTDCAKEETDVAEGSEGAVTEGGLDVAKAEEILVLDLGDVEEMAER